MKPDQNWLKYEKVYDILNAGLRRVKFQLFVVDKYIPLLLLYN